MRQASVLAELALLTLTGGGCIATGPYVGTRVQSREARTQERVDSVEQRVGTVERDLVESNDADQGPEAPSAESDAEAVGGRLRRGLLLGWPEAEWWRRRLGRARRDGSHGVRTRCRPGP